MSMPYQDVVTLLCGLLSLKEIPLCTQIYPKRSIIGIFHFSGKLRCLTCLSCWRLTEHYRCGWQNKHNLLKLSVVRPYLLTPAGRGSLFLSWRACHHQAPASLTPHNGPSLTPVSSWRTPPPCHLPPESCPPHLDPKRERGGIHNEEWEIQATLKWDQECFSLHF